MLSKNLKETTIIVKYRGAIVPDLVIPKIKVFDYSFIKNQKMGFHLSYETNNFQFHIVDKFASFPLFYTIVNNKLYVSERVDDLIPHLKAVEFDAVGYYGSGGNFRGERSHKTLFKGIKRIMPGHYLEYKNGNIKNHCYWSFQYLGDKPFQGNFDEACEELGYLVSQSVKRCYEFAPDAELHLSGGLDSGSIAALICQLSPSDRNTHTLLLEGKSVDDYNSESGFIKKYKAHYPQIKTNFYTFSVNVFNKVNLFEDASNWYGIGPQNPECTVARSISQQHKKYVLTGLGGDELASFGHSTHNVFYSIYNDRQASLYINWMADKKVRWRQIIVAALKRNKKISVKDAWYVARLMKGYLNYSSWYTVDFRKKTEKQMNVPALLEYYIPAAYEYRLNMLDRSFFTHRSDVWNYIGQKYNIDYLHPLLDGDLVDFCATLPRALFKPLKRRELFKTALKKYIPNELMEGTKRPGNSQNKIDSNKQIERLIDLKRGIQQIKGTFSGAIYNLNRMEELTEEYQYILKRIPSRYLQTHKVIEAKIRTINLLVLRAKNLNHIFK